MAKELKQDYVTLYTDASWRENIGTYAFWGRHNAGRSISVGVCPSDLKNINHAEFYAICQGMHKALKKWPGNVKGFFIFTDSSQIMASLNRSVKALKTNKQLTHNEDEIFVRLRASFEKMITSNSLDVIIRHIKGHTGQTDKTNVWLNSWCDKEARKLLRSKFKTP